MLISIASRVLQYKPNISKQNGYFIDLEANNFQNKLHFVVNATSLNDFSCLSDYLYVNADNI